MIAALAWQVFRIVLGYLAAVAATTLIFVILVWLMAMVLPESGLRNALTFSLVAILVFPAVIIFAICVGIVVSWIPAIVAALLAEAAELTSWAWHVLFALVVAAASMLSFDPFWLDGFSTENAILAACLLFSSAAGGIIYWAIAGRRSGQWRRAA